MKEKMKTTPVIVQMENLLPAEIKGLNLPKFTRYPHEVTPTVAIITVTTTFNKHHIYCLTGILQGLYVHQLI